ncbi:MAG: hypothetical protein ACOCTI_00345 [Phycisphaeraceae bacterium]
MAATPGAVATPRKLTDDRTAPPLDGPLAPLARQEVPCPNCGQDLARLTGPVIRCPACQHEWAAGELQPRPLRARHPAAALAILAPALWLTLAGLVLIAARAVTQLQGLGLLAMIVGGPLAVGLGWLGLLWRALHTLGDPGEGFALAMLGHVVVPAGLASLGGAGWLAARIAAELQQTGPADQGHLAGLVVGTIALIGVLGLCIAGILFIVWRCGRPGGSDSET